MNELLERIAALQAEGAIAALDDDGLVEADGALTAAVGEIDLDNVTDEDVALLESIETTATAIRAEAAARSTAREERATRAAEIAARILPPEAAEGEQAETESAEGETATPATAETPAPEPTPAEPAPEPTPAPTTVAAPAPVPTQAPPAAPVAEAPVPVAASGSSHTTEGHITSVRTIPVPASTSLGRASTRLGAHNRPAPAQRTSPGIITAAGDVGGFSTGQTMTVEELSVALGRKMDALPRTPGNVLHKLEVATITTEYPEDRRLSANDAAHNQRLLDEVTAAGGPCGPVAVDWSLATIGTAERPLAGGLQQYQGSRGGVRFQQPPTLGDYDEGVSVWTQATDESAGALAGTTTKPCVRIDCGDEVVVRTEAIPVCATFGNFIARNYPERVNAMRELLLVTAARFTEARHLTAITAGSTNHPKNSPVLGAARDLLTYLDVVIAQAFDRHRMAEGSALTATIPRWLRRMVRTDLTRELPGSTAERLATADAAIDQWLAVRGVTPLWLLDGPNGATFPDVAGGSEVSWPTTATLNLFPTGTWKHLDDGELNLSVSGPYHDSVLNQTNDAQIWMETFENVYMQGVWSYRLPITLCPNGATSATEAVGCLTGS